MYKARSRLSEPTSTPPTSKGTTTRFAKIIPRILQILRSGASLLHIPWAGYFHHLPTLGLGILCAILVWQLLTTVPPTHVQHFLFPNSYLPLTGLFFATCFFCSSFVLLNSRRGLVVASCLTWLVFLRLNQVEISLDILGYILLFFGILELLLTTFEWLAPKIGMYLHANIKQENPSENRPKPEGTTRYTPRRPRLSHRR